MPTVERFEDLRVWQEAREIVVHVYRLTRGFPTHERYGLASQMQRAAVSIPSNIAEGHNRLHKKEYIQFLNVAQGSCAELETQLVVAMELGYLNPIKFEEISNQVDLEGKQIRALVAKLTST